MINLRMESSSVNRGIIDDEGIVDSISSSSEVSSVESSESSDLMDEATSSSPPVSMSSSASSSSSQLATSPLHDMSSLMLQLPLKRGLSKYFQGKSQSFTSLANVRSLEDLAKPDNPYNKKLKSCRSYGGGLSESHKSTSHLPRITSSSRFISKRAQSSRVSSFSRGSAQRNPSFIGNKPSMPHPPHRSTSTISFSNQTPLFA